MIIMLIGNIASGKSTLAKKLEEKLPDFKRLSIDEFREKFNSKKTEDGEIKAQKELIKQISLNKNVIIESTGTGKFYPFYFNDEKHPNPKIIFIDSTISLCKERHLNRMRSGYSLPPLPSGWTLTIEKSLNYMDKTLKNIKRDFTINSKDNLNENTLKVLNFLNIKL